LEAHPVQLHQRVVDDGAGTGVGEAEHRADPVQVQPVAEPQREAPEFERTKNGM
jgi:hypothetical protein